MRPYVSRKIQKRARQRRALSCSGGARRNRTADLLNAIQALSQLSYGPEFSSLRRALYGDRRCAATSNFQVSRSSPSSFAFSIASDPSGSSSISASSSSPAKRSSVVVIAEIDIVVRPPARRRRHRLQADPSSSALGFLRRCRFLFGFRLRLAGSRPGAARPYKRQRVELRPAGRTIDRVALHVIETRPRS